MGTTSMNDGSAVNFAFPFIKTQDTPRLHSDSLCKCNWNSEQSEQFQGIKINK